MIKANNRQIDLAIKLLQQEQAIAFPTDTLYGLGADPYSEKAIDKVFALKGRSYEQALPILLPNIEDMFNWIDQAGLSKVQSQKIFDLAEKFWPGPLTIVTKKSKKVSNLLTANQDTIALRIPNHPLALELLKAFNSAIIGTSANKSGEPSLTTAQEVINIFGENLFVLDGGKCPLGIGSTIISIMEQVKILRVGAISLEELSNYF